MYLSISILMLFLRTNRIQPSSRSFMHSWRTSKLLLMIVINRYILIHSRYKRNLKRMYIVHANFWFRVSSYVISLFPSPSALLSLAPFSCPPLSLPTYLLYLPTYLYTSFPSSLRSGPGLSNAVWSTPSSSMIFLISVTPSQLQFSLRGFWGAEPPSFSI